MGLVRRGVVWETGEGLRALDRWFWRGMDSGDLGVLRVLGSGGGCIESFHGA